MKEEVTVKKEKKKPGWIRVKQENMSEDSAGEDDGSGSSDLHKRLLDQEENAFVVNQQLQQLNSQMQQLGQRLLQITGVLEGAAHG